ncbi:MAG: MBL fold metallo-hydrolase, partial [Eubacteriales bacterium]|nr:MBL fold metallo-hydrolase [Eubacteriales bacterium]
IEWNEEELTELTPQLIFTDGPAEIAENIRITGTVPVGDDFRPTEFFYCKDGMNLIDDDMSHEQCLVIREPEGLYIFSGCSHRGVINSINAGKAMFPGERVAVLVAGMHLYSSTDEDRKRVVEEIVAEKMDMVMPVHCTGIKAICDLKTKLEDRCFVATAGDEYPV